MTRPQTATRAAAGTGRSPVRERIIDAVDELARGRGWSATTMADVAKAAGVSRQTVYNEFGSRPDLVGAYVAREIVGLLNAVEDVVRSNSTDPHAALLGAFHQFLRVASDETLVRVIVDDAAGEELIRQLTIAGVAMARDRLGVLIRELWPLVSADDAGMVSEILARLAISHALTPTGSAHDAAAAITRLAGPFIDLVTQQHG